MDKVMGKGSSFPDPFTDGTPEAGRDFPPTTNGEVTGNNHGGIPIGNSAENSFGDDGLHDGGDEILESEERFLSRQSLERNNNNDTASWRKYAMRLVVGVVLVSAIAYVIVDFCGDRKIESALEEFLEWTHAHTYEGMIVVILCYIVATVCFVPGSMLSFGAGFAIGSSVDNTAVGILLASTAVFIGASLGSICSFLLGRYLFRDCVLQLAYSYPIFQAVERALETNGIKIMVLLRLSPLIPYNALDYISGVTSISLRDYALAMFGMLPGIVMLCFIGASASGLSDRTSSTSTTTVKIITIVSGVVFGGGGIFLVSYYSKQELDRILAAQSSANNTSGYIHEVLSSDEPDEIPVGFRDEEGNSTELMEGSMTMVNPATFT